MATGLSFFILFLVVLALVGVTCWLFLRFGASRGKAIPRPKPVRLAVMEFGHVDRHRSLVLIRRDNTEHLLMIGGPTDLVIESRVVREQAQPKMSRPRAPERPYERAAPLPSGPQTVKATFEPNPQTDGQQAKFEERLIKTRIKPEVHQKIELNSQPEGQQTKLGESSAEPRTERELSSGKSSQIRGSKIDRRSSSPIQRGSTELEMSKKSSAEQRTALEREEKLESKSQPESERSIKPELIKNSPPEPTSLEAEHRGA